MWTSISAIAFLARAAQMDSLRQLLRSQGETYSVTTWIGELIQFIEKSKRLKYCRIYTYADRWVTLLDALQGWATSEGALRHDSGREPAAASCIT
jgi:hypothetical protein